MFLKIKEFNPSSFIFRCTSKSKEEIHTRILRLTANDLISLNEFLKINIARSVNEMNELKSWFYITYQYPSRKLTDDGLDNYFNCEKGMHISLSELLKNTRYKDIVPPESQPIEGSAFKAMEMAQIYTSFRMTLEICEMVLSIVLSIQEEIHRKDLQDEAKGCR